MSVSPTDVEHARAFAPTMIEVASLNAKVSGAILARIDSVRTAGALAPSASLLVLGPAGAGKTHLFERLRRQVGAGATFVHVRPEIGNETTLQRILFTVVDALKQPVANREYSQLDVVAGSALAHAAGGNPKFPTAFLDEARTLTAEQREALIQRALDCFERDDPRLDTSWLELFFAVPFADGAKRRASLSWLSGREPSELELSRLGRSEPMPSSATVGALRALATVAARTAPLVIVFDQLENLVESDGRSDRIHAYARAFAELHDEVSRMVLVQMALDAEWVQRIGPELAASERSRLEAQVVHVELPLPGQRDELLRCWLEQVPTGDVPGAFPAPFTVHDWQRLRTQAAVTPRMILVAARRAMLGEAPPATKPEASDEAVETEDTLARSWKEALETAHAELEQVNAEKRGVDEGRLAAAIRVLLLASAGKLTPVNARRGRETLRFARASDPETQVFVVQSTNGRSVATALGHANKAAETQRLILVREQALALPPTWKVANQRLDSLRQSKNATVMDVGRPELARALALHDLVADARSQDLAGPDGSPIPEATVHAWVQRSLEPASFALALGDASLDQAAAASAPFSPPAAAPSTQQSATLPRQPPTVPNAPSQSRDGPATRVLRELRLASFERVVAEVQRREPSASRARVHAELRANPRVHWFGRTIVHLPSEAS
jgi:hypothetical protein